MTPNQDRAAQAAFDGYVPQAELEAARAEIARVQHGWDVAFGIAVQHQDEVHRLRSELALAGALALANTKDAEHLRSVLGAVRCYVIFATTDARLSTAGREEAEKRLALVNTSLDGQTVNEK